MAKQTNYKADIKESGIFSDKPINKTKTTKEVKIMKNWQEKYIDWWNNSILKVISCGVAYVVTSVTTLILTGLAYYVVIAHDLFANFGVLERPTEGVILVSAICMSLLCSKLFSDAFKLLGTLGINLGAK